MYIVNLSALCHYSVLETLPSFGRIYDMYDTPSPYVPDCIQSLFNIVRVAWLYHNAKETIIDPFKLGQTSAKDFLNQLASHFPLSSFNEATRHQILAGAWSSSIRIDDIHRTRFERLKEIAESGIPVYLISNSNVLDIATISKLYGLSCPEEGLDKTPQIASEHIPDMKFCLSYKYGYFKTDGLIDEVLKSHPKQEDEIILISQWEGDLAKGQKLGMKSISPEEFDRQLDHAPRLIM